ncbi:MAG: CoA pyrophosphatase [Deltaproteobacteria bacterium]|nr:CoA pyrophosphatase [Deltaproteobacteria bacterium]
MTRKELKNSPAAQVDDFQFNEKLLLNNNSRFRQHVIRILGDRLGQQPAVSNSGIDWHTTAGVLMLFGQKPASVESGEEPCLVLNKRSLKVRQPGDLCFPGGSMSPRIDPYLARIFSLPIASLGRWPYWNQRKKYDCGQAKTMSIIWATALRESFEEMRLNPFGVEYLGPLPPQSLVMFKRTIYPMVGWIRRQKRFFPNWEVETVLHVSLKDLLSPNLYGRYRLRMEGASGQGGAAPVQDFPCFRIQTKNRTEILWGATYRITLDFLKFVFDFTPPALRSLPMIEGALDESYISGSR